MGPSFSHKGRRDLTPDHRAVESLLAFWAEAGVDACFEDSPVDRIAERVRPIRPPAAPRPQRRLPRDLTYPAPWQRPGAWPARPRT